MKLHYKEVGSRKPLVIIHGLFGSGDNWMTLARQLSAEYRVILPDMRCHGKSEDADSINYNLMANDLFELLNDLGLDKIFLAGHSMGGKVSMKFVDTHPEMVEKLMIIDIANRKYDLSSHHEIIDAALSVKLDKNSTRSSVEEELSESISNFDTRQFIMKSLGRDKSKNLAWDLPFAILKRELDNIGSVLSFESDINASPTLIVNGSKSPYVNIEDHNLLKKQFINLEIQTIANAGHWVHAEKPIEILKAFKTFFTYE